ncbi:intermembrane transport protein PqiB [Sulfitobacter sp. S190]|uniref:PqiB family protein n=1 Tax=Sulfitobacter sp. S190 TaxID=2867022 RepID=UPI0021A6EAAE|nr:MlaD family protein [Sulfitobacter sp. S190]UWR22714.1 MlaD family protein [Sulfitobacter sp. S190]
MAETPPPVHIRPARKPRFSGASVIWLIPLLALVAALAVAVQNYNSRGPLIVVAFQDGAGIAAGETELRYRDISVGKVEKVGFSSGLGQVEAHIRVKKDIAPYIDNGSVFWIVEPEVSARGITGLSTVLSGVYIQGSWDDNIGLTSDRFVGSSQPPLIRPGESGLQLAFRTTTNGELTDNAPILFRGIEVGRVGKAQIANSGAFAIVEALIYDSHRDLINSSTRFWDVSGVSVSIGPGGADVEFSSLATLVGGGLTFDTFVSGGEPVQDGAVFEVYGDKDSARNSLFTASEVEPLQISVIFEENISGLATGADVELSGFKVGVVDSLSGVVDTDQFGDSRVRLNVILAIQPARLGLKDEVTADAALQFLAERVQEGLRARLASASLLTGGLKVELVEVEDPFPATLTTSGADLPIFPTTQSETSDAAATVEGVFNRINNLPIEELLNSAIRFLDNADALVSSEDIRQTPGDVRTLVGDLSELLTSDDIKNVPVALNATLVRIEDLVADLEEQRVTDILVQALTDASDAANSVTSSVEGVPELVEDLQEVAAKANSLELNALLEELTVLTRSADALVSSPDTAELPAALKGALDEVNATLGELRAGGAVTNVNQTLASARNAADSIAVSAQDLPRVVNRISALLTQASRTIEGYNKGDQISRSAENTLRDISEAADALAKLARTIERNPNSLLLGR